MTATKSWPADKVSRWPIEKLVPYAKNSRVHTPKQIAAVAKSIKKFGWTSPILVDETGNMIAGHARVAAARQIGLTEVPVMVATGWTDAEKRAYSIADNKLHDESAFDSTALVMELGDLASLGFDLSATGFDADSLADLLAPPAFGDDLGEGDEADGEAQVPAITVSVPNAIDIPSVASILRRALKQSGYRGVKVREPRPA